MGEAVADPAVSSPAVGAVLGAPEAGPDESVAVGVAVAVAVAEVDVEGEGDDVLRECDASSPPPASAVPVIAATSAPEVSRTSDARFMANLL
ncbi:hypothetical protein ACJWDR_42075 [Streptomyces tauricus]|uniref:hypothetical protein n=1 Tax=Streptomyces tauricus TaxID=68274 RepID=UPI00387F2DDA